MHASWGPLRRTPAEGLRARRKSRPVRVLLLTHRIPFPPDKGEKIRSFHLLAALAAGHEVDLVTHVDDPRDRAHRRELESLCSSVSLLPLGRPRSAARSAGALALGRPLSVAWGTRPGGSRRVRELLARRGHDLIVGSSSQVGAYLPASGGPPVLFDLVDVDSEKWAAYGRRGRGPSALVHRLEAARLRAFEMRLGLRVRRLVVCTGREARCYRERVLDREVDVVANGAPCPGPEGSGGLPGLMLFVGTMSYPANAEAAEVAARQVLPRVRAAIPEACLRIVGRDPSPRVRRLGELPGVEVTGAVDDVRPHLREALLGLFPLQVVRGVPNKVLEALGHGLPVVATPEVPQCLESGAGDAVAVAPDPEGLARCAVELLKDPELRRRRGAGGVAYVRERHDWTAVEARWRALADETAAGRQAGVPAGRA